MEASVWKSTQKHLSPFVKKPALTEKLLSRPPFRFLHDLISVVIKEHKVFKGLYDAKEMKSDQAGKDRESKIKYLEKIIAAVAFATDEADLVSKVKPAKIVSGQEAEKTNLFLQALAKVLEKKLDTAEAVRCVLKGEKPKAESKTGKMQPVKEEAKDDNNEDNGNKEKNEHKEEQVAKEDKKEKKEEKEEEKGSAGSAKDIKENIEVKVEEKEVEESKKEMMETKEKVEESKEKEIMKEKEESKPDQSAAEPEQVEQDASAEKQEDKNNEMKNKTENKEVLEPKKIMEKSEMEPKSPARSPMPAVRPGSAMRSARPGTGRGRMATGRPPSARPAAPRIPDKAEIAAQEEMQARPKTGKVVNVILANANDDDDDDDAYLVQEKPKDNLDLLTQGDTKANMAALASGGEEHGVLVQQILETQKELEEVQQTKTKSDLEKELNGDEKESSIQLGRDRGSAEREVSRLRISLQTLTRAANPLAKLMDYLQEDLDSMQRELANWSGENEKLQKSLRQEELLTEQALGPLKSHLLHLDDNIRERLEQIADAKAAVLRNENRINKLVESVGNHALAGR